MQTYGLSFLPIGANTLTTNERRLDILLAANHPTTVGAVREALETSGTRCLLHATEIDQIQRISNASSEVDGSVHDLVLFDLIRPDEQAVETLKILKGPAFQSTPVVLLTDGNETPDISALKFDDDRYTTFAPVELDSFLNALNSIRPARFMEAISLLENFGFVVVRMPSSDARRTTRPRRYASTG